MPQLIARRGLAILLWDTGDFEAFASLEDAITALNLLVWTQETNTAILTAYGAS